MYRLAFLYICEIISDAIWAAIAIQMPLKLKLKKSAASGCATGKTGVRAGKISLIRL